MKIIHGYVKLEDMTIRIQFHINALCSLEKLPDFNYSYKEKESEGGGWYGSTITVQARHENAYLVIHNGNPIGFISATENGKVILQGKNSNNFIKKYIESWIKLNQTNP